MSLLDLILYYRPADGIDAFAFDILHSIFSLLYAWIAMVVIFIVSRKSPQLKTHWLPIPILCVIIPVRGYLVLISLTAKITTQKQIDDFWNMHYLAIWPMYLATGIGLIWYWAHNRPREIKSRLGITLAASYAILIYVIISPAAHGYLA